MKFITKVFSLFLLISVHLHGHNHQEVVTSVITQQAHKCVCGPAEHWLYKSCVKLYNQRFPQANLIENNNSENLPENVIQAIEFLVLDMNFLDAQGNIIAPEVNVRGAIILPMSKSQDYVLCKKILHEFDINTNLSAEELYSIWYDALCSMKLEIQNQIIIE